jgi:hypothetical protein
MPTESRLSMTRRQAQLIVAGHVSRDISHRCRRAQDQGLLKGLIFIEEVERVYFAQCGDKKKKGLDHTICHGCHQLSLYSAAVLGSAHSQRCRPFLNLGALTTHFMNPGASRSYWIHGMESRGKYLINQRGQLLALKLHADPYPN